MNVAMNDCNQTVSVINGTFRKIKSIGNLDTKSWLPSAHGRL